MMKDHMDGYCHKCMGIKILLLGVVIILNAVYGWLDWGVFIGAVVAIKGLMMLSMSKCSHKK